MTPNIFVCGLRHAGKDTAADAILSVFPRAQKIQIAAPVYALAESRGMVGKVRGPLQAAGDDLRRWYGRDSLTTHLLLSTITGEWACPDIRFPHEGQLLREHGWIGLRIERPENERLASLAAVGEDTSGEVSLHATEMSVDAVPVDLVIQNDGTREDLAAKVLAAVLEIRSRRGVVDIAGIGADAYDTYAVGGA